MTRQTRTQSRHSQRSQRPGLWVLAIVVLVVVLALAACGGRARNGGNNGTASGNTNTSQQYSGSGSNGNGGTNTSDLSSDDQQVQSAIQTLDSAASDANTDYSGQDNNIVP